MASGSTPGPGLFGPSPAFGRIPHPGVHVMPAKTIPRPGIYSGPPAVTHPSWLALAVLAAALLLAAATLTHFLRRR
jgi:hypothetical protein